MMMAPGLMVTQGGGTAAQRGMGEEHLLCAVTPALSAHGSHFLPGGRCQESSTEQALRVLTFPVMEFMEHNNSVTTALPPLPTWTRHLNLSRDELESLLQRINHHSNPVISVLRNKDEEIVVRDEDGLNNVILVGSGLFILLLLLIVIKYKPEERLKR